MPYQEPLIKQVKQTLASILTDSRFNASPQMSAFLTYIVEQTLEGHATRIKAYTIAVDALGKSDDFDPQTNPSVRVLAKRLRDTLSQYYDGKTDVEIKICLTPGSYVPQFEAYESNAAHMVLDKLKTAAETRKVFETRLKPALSIGFAKYHRQTTVLGIMLMATLVWNVSPHYQKKSDVPVVASAIPAQRILSIDIASMEQINNSQERPQLPSITIVNDNLQSQDYKLISNAIHDKLSRYEHVIIDESSRGNQNADSPKWPEDYLLHYSRTNDSQVDIFVSHAKSGKIIQRKSISMPSNTLEQNTESVTMFGELNEFSESLLRSRGSILQDYKIRGDMTPTMQCAFLFDAYYANKTKVNRNAATQCAERLHNEGSINSTPRIL